MRSVANIAVVLMLTALFACTSSKHEPSPVDNLNAVVPLASLNDVVVERAESNTLVKITGKGRLDYSLFSLSEPQRLVVDFSKCEQGELPALTEVQDGLITMITVNEFKDGDREVVRLMVGFSHETDFTVREEPGAVVLRIAHPEGYKPSEAVAVAPVEPEESAPVVEEPAVAEAPVVAEAPQCIPGEPLFMVQSNGRKSNAVVRKISVVNTENGVMLDLGIKGNVPAGSYEIFRLCEPERIVIDIFGAKSALKKRNIEGDGDFVGKLRVGSHKDKLRIVADMNKVAPSFEINSGNRNFELALFEVIEEQPAVAVVPETEINDEKSNSPEPTEIAVETPAEKPVVESTAAVALAKVLKIDFKQSNTGSSVVVKLSDRVDYKIISAEDKQLVLELPGTDLPDQLEQSLDTSEFDSPISLVSSFRSEDDPNKALVVVQLRETAANRVNYSNGELVWKFDFSKETLAAGTPSGQISIAENGEMVVEYEPIEAAGVVGAATHAAASNIGARKEGQRISLELKNTDILDVLRLVADVSKLNIIASDNVRGTVTVRLLNVPWQQALSIILRSKQLGQERLGNIIRVAPLEELQAERELRINRIKAKRELEPLSTRLIPLSYADAALMVDKIRDLLTKRGTVSFDERTNVIIVQDIDESLAKAEALVTKLDLQTPQVMIEAKIVEADVQSERGFGIQWGGYYTMSEQTGNATGLAFPANWGVNGSTDATAAPGLPNSSAPPSWAVNLPYPTPTSALGFNFGSVNNAANLALRLSAAESSGNIKILSSPKITTLDNKEATIEQGLQLPIMSVTITGVPTTKMINATLALKVKPHITADGSIIMSVEIKKEEPDFSRVNSLGDPAIIKKSAKTDVLVRTGETTVIGGIYTKKVSKQESGVPGLSKIPILGWLFKSKRKSTEKTELLIFVTPRIVARTASTLTSE